MPEYRALMPDSTLPATRIEERLRVIHGFEKVKNVAELGRGLRANSTRSGPTLIQLATPARSRTNCGSAVPNH